MAAGNTIEDEVVADTLQVHHIRCELLSNSHTVFLKSGTQFRFFCSSKSKCHIRWKVQKGGM